MEFVGSRLLLMISIVVLLASLAWSVMTLLRPVEPLNIDTIPAASQAEATAGDKTDDYAQLGQWHLFGQAPKAPPAQPPKRAIQAPQTRLSWKLHGVIHHNNGEDSYAIIELDNGKQKQFRVGDKLAENTKLVEIGVDGVTLSRAGKYESLLMRKPKLLKQLKP